MSSIKRQIQFSNIKSVEELGRYLSAYSDEVQNVVNGDLELERNIRGTVLDVVFGMANTSTTITHNLGYIPRGYYQIDSSAATSLYNGGQPWTTVSIFVKSSAVATVKMFIF